MIENFNPIQILSTIGVSEGMKVGDFGCGQRGTFIFAAAGIVGDKGMVCAVDVLKSVLRTINNQARLDGVEHIVKTVWSNLEKYGATAITDDSLDVGLLINVLLQTEQEESVIQESARMIKKGGTLFVCDWLADSYLAKVAEQKHTDMQKESLTGPQEVKQIAGDLGLQFIEEFKLWESHYGLVFIK